jgi:phosphoglucosamine mutase
LEKYFGTDGFRGEANVSPNAFHAFKLGCFLAEYCRAQGRRGEGCRIVIGKDPRKSSYMLEYALAAGITSCGADAYLLHVTTTPSVSYITRAEGFDYGVMISASHNRYRDNGIKLLNADGEKPQETISIAENYLNAPFHPDFVTGDKVGRTVDYIEGRNRYMGYLLSLAKCSYRGKKIGLDCANGSAFHIAPAVFHALGAQVYAVNASPNGLNINENCGSTHAEVLARFVRENALDVGFAFDGDADRCICVDEKGQIVDGDGILYLSALYLRSRGEGDGEVVMTVLSNGGLSRALADRGIPSCRVAVGDKNVYARMRESGSCLGGESSGHIIYGKYAATGDGILTAIKVMEAMSEEKKPLSALLDGYTPLPHVLLNVPVKHKEVALREDIRQKVAQNSGMGRVLLRPSGTEPIVRIYCEGESLTDCKILAEHLRDCILQADGEV